MDGIKKQSINNQMLKAVRKKLGLTQPELGDLLGCHFTDISRVERGLDTPDWLVKFVVLSRLLDESGMTWQDVIMDFPDPPLKASDKGNPYEV